MGFWGIEKQTEKNRNYKSPTLDEEQEDRKNRENMRIMSRSLSYFGGKLSFVNLSSYVSFFSPYLIQQTWAFPLSFCKIFLFF